MGSNPSDAHRPPGKRASSGTTGSHAALAVEEPAEGEASGELPTAAERADARADGGVTTLDAAPAADLSGAAQRRRRGIAVLVRVIQLGPALVLGVLWLVMSFLSPYFFTTLNFSNLLQAAAIPAVLALGQLVVIVTGGIDLSAGAVYVLVAIVGAKFANGAGGGNAVTTVLVMLAIGTALGTINGLLIEYVRIGSPFVVTLGTLSVVTGLAYIVSNGGTVTGLPHFIDQLGGGYIGRIPVDALVVAGIAALAYVATARIRWGRWVYAIGSNPVGASRVGIPVRAVTVSVFAISGLAAGVAGIFEAGLSNAGAPNISFTAELDAISAVVIGGAALTGGRGTVWGTIVGALILETIHNALNLLNVDTNWEPIVLGVVLLAAVGMEKARGLLETRLRLAEARLLGDL
jgi:ribose transport system permease protein